MSGIRYASMSVWLNSLGLEFVPPFEYRGPQIHVVDARRRHKAELPFIYRDYTEDNVWRLHFFAQGAPDPVTITVCRGGLDEFTAVEIAKRYVMQFGRLQVEVHIDD